MKTNVRAYTDEQLLDRVKEIKGFRKIPDGYWVIGVASNENESDVFDDKGYLFYGEKFIKVFQLTTNTGTYGLKNFKKWNRKGCFVIKTDQWIYKFWKTNLQHKGEMRAWRQNRACYYFRDNNFNNKAEEIGEVLFGMCGINFHTATYKVISFLRRLIGGWSTGCQVVPNTDDYYEILDMVDPVQDTVDYCILREFEPQAA